MSKMNKNNNVVDKSWFPVCNFFFSFLRKYSSNVQIVLNSEKKHLKKGKDQSSNNLWQIIGERCKEYYLSVIQLWLKPFPRYNEGHLTPKLYSVNEVRAPPPLLLSGQPNASLVQPARHCPQRGV